MSRPESRRHSTSNPYHEEVLAPPGSPTPWSTEKNVHGYVQAPPARTPSRPGSSRRRYSLKTSNNSHEILDSLGDIDPFGRLSRPSSSLSKYKPLPEINSSPSRNQESTYANMTDLSSELNHLELKTNTDGTSIKGNGRKDILKSQSNSKALKNSSKSQANSMDKKEALKTEVRKGKLKSKPEAENDNIKHDEQKNNVNNSSHDNRNIVLGIKLPTTGERVSQSFNSADSLHSVLQYVEGKCSENLSHKYYLAINVPRKIFNNPKISIKQAGLEDKTTLYLVEKEPV